MAGPTNSVGGYNSWEQNYDDFYSGTMAPPVASGGMLTQSGARPASVASTIYRAPTQAQMAAIRNVPANSYQRPGPAPITSTNIPYGSAYQNTGNYGRASGSMLEQLGLAGLPPITPPAAAQPNVQLPRPRPWFAPTSIDMAAINQPVGANPGMGGAMIGNGVMSPSIPPQGPPPAGIAPTVWAGADPQTLSRRTTRMPGIGPAQQYDALNLMGKVNALNRQAAGRAAGLMTPVQKLQAQGMTAAQAYAAANSSPGSVAAMEAKHSGRPSGSYTDSREPSGTGSLW